MIACFEQPLAPENRHTKWSSSFRLHQHEEALDISQALGIVFRDPRPVSRVDVAFFGDFVGSLRTAAPLS